MEGDSLSLYFWLSGSAVVFLFVLVVALRYRVQLLDQRLAEAARALPGTAQGGSQGVAALVTHAPFPVCYLDNQGRVEAASPAFWRLAGGKPMLLKDFNRATGANLHAVHKPQQRQLTLHTEGAEELRHFSLLQWPIRVGEGVMGSVCCLLERTRVVQHAQAQYVFDQELLSLQQELVSHLDHLPPEKQPVVTELKRLTDILVAEHRPHPTRSWETFDLVTAVRRVLEEYKQPLRTRNIAVTSTLPSKAWATGFVEETLVALRTVLAAVTEHARPHTTLRLHVTRGARHTTLSLSLPEVHPAHGRALDVFAFGSKAGKREAQARLALVRLLMGHQNGTVRVTVDDEEGATIHLSFFSGSKQ